jgi:hypothetical protein
MAAACISRTVLVSFLEETISAPGSFPSAKQISVIFGGFRLSGGANAPSNPLLPARVVSSLREALKES